MAQASLLSPSPQAGEVTAESFAGHVIGEIARTRGPQLPCYRSGEVLNGFLARFGLGDGMAICDRAFNGHGGMWRGAPVTVARFAAGQDDFFARPLLEEARAARPLDDPVKDDDG